MSIFKKLFLSILIIGVSVSTLTAHTSRHQSRPFPLTWTVGVGSATAPSMLFQGDPDTGFYWISANAFGVTQGGTGTFQWTAEGFKSALSGGPLLVNEAATATNPTVIPREQDATTGMGSAGAGIVTIVTGGTEAVRFDASQNTTLAGNLTLIAPITIGSAEIDEAELEILDGATLTTAQINFLNAATGTTGTTSTNLVYSTSPVFVTPTLGAATATSITIDASATPAVIFRDSGNPGTDKEIAQINANYLSGADGAEDGAMFLQAMLGGSEVTWLQFDADTELITSAYVQASKPVDFSGTPQAGLAGGLKYFGYAIALTDAEEDNTCTLGGTGVADCFILETPTSYGRLKLHSSGGEFGSYLVKSDGVITEADGDADSANMEFNVAGVANCANDKICVFDNGSNVGIQNNIAATTTIMVQFWYD